MGAKKMILITGASGSVGKAVLQEAIRKEPKVRAMYRSKGEAAKAPSGCEAVLADYSDKHSLRKALNGVSSVYVVCSPIPQLVEGDGSDLERRAGEANFESRGERSEVRGHTGIGAARGDARLGHAGVAGDGAPGSSAVLRARRRREHGWPAAGLDRTRSRDTRSISHRQCQRISRSGRIRLKRESPDEHSCRSI